MVPVALCTCIVTRLVSSATHIDRNTFLHDNHLEVQWQWHACCWLLRTTSNNHRTSGADHLLTEGGCHLYDRAKASYVADSGWYLVDSGWCQGQQITAYEYKQPSYVQRLPSSNLRGLQRTQARLFVFYSLSTRILFVFLVITDDTSHLTQKL